jgi:hypothetical protein
MDVNVHTTKTHGMTYFLFELMKPDHIAQQVFELVTPIIIDAGLQDTCVSLINFLTVASSNPWRIVICISIFMPNMARHATLKGMLLSHTRESTLYGLVGCSAMQGRHDHGSLC